jgi:hypothetical protein
MKKLTLTLMTILTLSISAYFVSCKKEAEPAALLLPAVQKIRDFPSKGWEVADKALLELPITFNQKLKSEFVNFETDSNIVVTVRVRFKEKKEDVLLPYVEPFLGGTKYYFYSLSGGKPKLFFYNTAISDFGVSGTSSALPVEKLVIVYEQMDIE